MHHSPGFPADLIIKIGQIQCEWLLADYLLLLQAHFCWSIQYTHALCCRLYTILGLSLC